MTQHAFHRPALLFDLDGTLVDSVYQHVLAWHEALEEMGLSLAVWRIHRRIGMSGGLLIQALGREIGHRLTQEQAQMLQEKHSAAFERYKGAIQPLPGARELLRQLSDAGVAYAIATSGRREGAQPAIDKLEVRPEVPIITRNEVEHAKPDPDLFLAAAQRVMFPSPTRWSSETVSGTCWPPGEPAASRLGCFQEGMEREELQQVGAYRVYQDPADLLAHLDEVGIRISDRMGERQSVEED